MSLAAERTFFDGDHAWHVAAYEDEQERRWKRKGMVRLPRVSLPLDVTDERLFPNMATARAHLAGKSADERAELHAEWVG